MGHILWYFWLIEMFMKWTKMCSCLFCGDEIQVAEDGEFRYGRNNKKTNIINNNLNNILFPLHLKHCCYSVTVTVTVVQYEPNQHFKNIPSVPVWHLSLLVYQCYPCKSLHWSLPWPQMDLDRSYLSAKRGHARCAQSDKLYSPDWCRKLCNWSVQVTGFDPVWSLIEVYYILYPWKKLTKGHKNILMTMFFIHRNYASNHDINLVSTIQL